jgi:hypothetical protein
MEVEGAKVIAADRLENAKMKKQGYTHRFDAWVHPARGDDYSIVGFTKFEPTAGEMAQILKRKGSQVLTDYQVSEL